MLKVVAQLYVVIDNEREIYTRKKESTPGSCAKKILSIFPYAELRRVTECGVALGMTCELPRRPQFIPYVYATFRGSETLFVNIPAIFYGKHGDAAALMVRDKE